MKASEFLDQKSASEFLDEDLEPTPTAAAQMHKDAPGGMLTMRQAFPIAGDIATSMVPAGKLIKGATLLPKLARGALKALQAGLGSAGGELIGQQVYDEPLNIDKAMSEFYMGAGGQMGLDVVARGAKALEKPALELVSDVTFLGKRTKDFLRRRLERKTTERAQKFLADFAPGEIKGTEGFVDYARLEALMGEGFDESSVLYGKRLDALRDIQKMEGPIPVDEAQFVLQNIREDLIKTGVIKPNKKGVINQGAADNAVLKRLGIKGNFNTGFPLELKNVLRAGHEGIDADTLNALISQSFGSFQKLTPKERAAREKLKGAFKKDIDTFGTKHGINAKEISDDADQTYKALVRFNVLRKIFKRGFGKGKHGTVVRPQDLHDAIYAAKKQIRREFPDTFDEIWPKLESEAKYYGQLAPEFEYKGQDLLQSLSAPIWYKGGPMVGASAEVLSAASAIALVDPTTRKIIERFLHPAIYAGAKAAEATGLRMMGEPIMFD
jgi:hypothetical protein